VTLAVEVQRAARGTRLPTDAQFEAWARAAWRGGRVPAELVVRVVDADESRELNRTYRGRDRPTNVLSFPVGDMPGPDLAHIGDLVLCAPVVEREAGEQHKPVEAHWAHMVVHGVLHLQGHDHQDDAQAEAMETLETAILAGLGYPAPYLEDEIP
jgi:probable rRNA maturation factor